MFVQVNLGLDVRIYVNLVSLNDRKTNAEGISRCYDGRPLGCNLKIDSVVFTVLFIFYSIEPEKNVLSFVSTETYLTTF